MELTMWSDEKQMDICVNCRLPVLPEQPHYGPYTCISYLIAKMEEQTARADELAAEVAAVNAELESALAVVALYQQRALTAEGERDDANIEVEADNMRLVELAAEVERLTAERDDANIEVAAGNTLLAELTADNAALRAQLAAAGQEWRAVDEPPAADMDVEMIVRGGYRYDDNEFFDEFFSQMEMPTHWRPATD